MRRTTILDLIPPFVIIGIATYTLLKVSYDSIPLLGYVVPVPLAALAVIELVIARRIRAAVRHDPEAKPMTAIAIARCVALGKASSIVGAAVAGASVALLFYVGPDAHVVRQAATDTRVASLLLGAALLVVVAGLVLERSGIDPNREKQDGSTA